jgi:NitT/TauT family transport system ATP-binding protein
LAVVDRPRYLAAPPRDGALPSLAASAIRADGIGHVYQARSGRVPALWRVDLDVSRGSIVALLGPSGCGKSTLLRILAGVVAPTAGTVSLGGQTPRAARRALGIGWLAQDDGLLPWRTVRQNVSLPLEMGRRAGSNTTHVDAMLAVVGLAEAARRYPHELSTGMRQRAALARAMVAEPAFLFLDEPFANLDEFTRERLGDLLLDVRASRAPTTLLVTHSVVEAVRLADRVVAFSGSPGTVLADLEVPLPRPRRFDQPGFGRVVQRLTNLLAGCADGGPRAASAG